MSKPGDEMPEESLQDDGKGTIKIAVGRRDGKVIIGWNRPLEWIGLDPQYAKKLGYALRETADKLIEEKRIMGFNSGETQTGGPKDGKAG